MTRELPPLSKMLNRASHNYGFDSPEAQLLGEYADTHAGLMAERAKLLAERNELVAALQATLAYVELYTSDGRDIERETPDWAYGKNGPYRELDPEKIKRYARAALAKVTP